jgi:hypothetical protein
MGLGGKMNHRFHSRAHAAIDSSSITNISSDECVVLREFYTPQTFQIACVCELVEIQDSAIRKMAKHVADEVAADETGAASD